MLVAIHRLQQEFLPHKFEYIFVYRLMFLQAYVSPNTV